MKMAVLAAETCFMLRAQKGAGKKERGPALLAKKPLELTRHALALSIGVPPRRINEIVHCKRSVSADTALRLARFFGTTPQFWTGLQAMYDAELARAKIFNVLKNIPRFSPGAGPSPLKQLVA